MKLLARYLKPFVGILLVCLVLLFGQAACDLSLPTLMSDMVNVGIQQSGLEAGAPEAMRQEGLQLLSTFAGEPTQNVGKSFIKSYAAVCLEGAIIVLACIIFSLFAAAPPAIDPNAAAVTQVWSYIGELVFNMLVLVGAVKMADRVVREMMGL